MFNFEKWVKNQKKGEARNIQVIGSPNTSDPTLYQVTDLGVQKGS